MLKKLTIAKNPLLPATWIEVETEDVIKTLTEHFEVFPTNARLYNGNVSKANDVTPQSEADVAAIAEMEGPFFAIEYPEGPLVLLAIAIVALVVVVALSFKPKIPNSTNRNVQSESPNNALSGRSNSVRINGRIPDIFGTVRSTPDLIAVPYSVFVSDVEVEYCYMCVGRGTYAILADDIRDGQTPCSQIDGESILVYGPNTSPNLASVPQLQIGSAIDRLVINALRSKSVNGQTLLASNEDTLNPSTMHFNFRYGGTIYFNVGDPGGVALDTLISSGDTITVTHAGRVAVANTFDWNNNSGTGRVVLDDGTAAQVLNLEGGFDITFDATVRFHSDGRIEFQDITNLGGGRDFNINGTAFVQLSNTAVTDGTHNANLDGKYILHPVDGSNLGTPARLETTLDWNNLAAFSGAVSPWKLVTFFCPQVPAVNLSGTYVVSAPPTSNTIPIAGASRVNSDWVWLAQAVPFSGPHVDWVIDQSAFINLGGLDSQWIGPFVLDVNTTTEIIANFIAAQGMYKDDGTTQTATSVDLQVGVTPCTSAGVSTGSEIFFAVTLTGSATKRGTKAITLFGDVPPGRYKVRARRVTPKDLLFVGQISDEVKWRDLYSSSPVGAIAFGDVTTIHTKTVATAEALAVSERQINLLVTRMIPLRVSGSTFTTDLHATNSADEIMSFICLDPKIGNRVAAEINFDNIYDTLQAVRDYFGIDEAGEFCYTIDSDNLSFEETLQMVAGVVFCQAFRRGNVIEISFEKKTDDSRLLFNHRNKVPSSETRTFTFGNVDGFDGVEYDYVSPIDDAVVTYYIPEDRSSVKPQKIQSIGVRNASQAYLHAWRAYNRLRFQHLAVEFEATQESEILANGDRILVADNSRPDTQDGEIESQSGLIIKLSQPAVLRVGVEYLISLQLPSGTVENIDITPGDDPYHAVLSSPPSEDLSTADDASAKTVYQILRVEDEDEGACLLTSKEYHSNFTCTLQAINYDERYYANDLDFV